VLSFAILYFTSNNATEEEKKLLAPLLGKLYISPASTEAKIREVYAEVSAAVDDKIIAEATGRNALYKIHVSLGKIVNSLTEKAPRSRNVSASVDRSTVLEDRTTILDESREEKPKMEDVEEEDEGTLRPTPGPDEMDETLQSSVETSTVDGEGDSSGPLKVEDDEDTTILSKQEPDESRLGRDSLVDSLLSDDDVDMSGM
jgi:condensin complex subunit 3